VGLEDLLRPKSTKEEAIDLEIERTDILTANIITFKFLVFKTSKTAPKSHLPRKIFFQFRFFNFPEIQTDPISLTSQYGNDEVLPGQNYNLIKETYVNTPNGRIKLENTAKDSELVTV